MMEDSSSSVTCNFPQFPKLYSREKVIPEQKQVQESNSNPGNEITERSDPPFIHNLETFAPVAKINTVRILLSLAAHYNWQLLQYDVKNAFLHGDLDEEIYMNIPPGFEGNTGNKVCKLKKALYGLKQSPRAWFGRFAKVMKESEYKQSQGDHTSSLSTRCKGSNCFLVYVDDIIVTRNDEREKYEVKQRLATEFEIKELGKLKYFLGIEVTYSTQGIFISQQKCVTDLLAEIGKIGCKPVSTPMDPNHKLGEAKEEPVGVALLKGNPGKGILFKKNNTLALEAYTDADYVGSLVDRRSTTGYCTFLGDDLRIKWDGPMKLYCDNKSAINIAHNPIQHDRTKHIEIDRHFIKEKLEEGVVSGNGRHLFLNLRGSVEL
ncbi:Retrovirus-related Pol polyprotein from transposon RE1 [Vitis vinifera]|uniref:Retrovirus-related Pol polyprotein from transposon RE1 n=1 Tax=Vitis vinifera TaxID=29760 RepID=A0A438KF62_VITVI|nr:Retrovirus-related Pol polyprotein from transposon RE1 [Vitis vinifera]